MPRLEHPLSDRFDEALDLAHRIHRHQARKGTQTPYIAHVMAVSAIVLEYGGSETEAIGALLHDALEDAPPELPASRVRDIIHGRFGDDVLTIVEHCSDSIGEPKPPWLDRKLRYVAAAGQAPLPAVIVSAADKLHNLRALIRDFRRKGHKLWAHFNPEAGMRGTLGYHRALTDIYQRRWPGPLADELARTMSELEVLAGGRGVWPPAQ